MLIIGTGFGGLSAADQLVRHEIDDFVMLEAADELGGVWRENVYPNCACDVQAQLYSFSFAPNPDWSSNFAPQPEILAYAKRVADQQGIDDHIRYGQTVTSAQWDGATQSWTVSTQEGATWRARHLVTAVGLLNRPLVPDIPGMSDFGGPVVHTARWDPELDVRGKRVMVIGAGASAIQVVPWSVQTATSTTTLVRTPPYVMPKPEEHYDETDRARFHARPELMLEIRQKLYDEWNASSEAQAVMDERFLTQVEGMWREHMESAVADPELRALLTPDYRFGCRRPVVSNDYYRALADPRCTVVGSGAARMTSTSVITEDGDECEADVVVLATGFQATDALGELAIRGTGGRRLADRWADAPRAYRGTLVPEFPNFYVMYGPNTQASGSIIGILEAQASLVRECVQLANAAGKPIEVTERAFDRFDDQLQAQMAQSVFAKGGCHSWYRLGGTGRVVVKWPGSLRQFEALAEAEPADFAGFNAGRQAIPTWGSAEGAW